MKATIDVPDDLYRQVKARSALESRTVREVTVALYRGWLEQSTGTVEGAAPTAASSPPAWFGAVRKYAKKVHAHDMASIRTSIERGRTGGGDE